MLTGEIRNQIDSIWKDFWAGGLANPLAVMEQMTYLLRPLTKSSPLAAAFDSMWDA